MNLIDDVIGALLDYCDRHPLVALALKVGVTLTGLAFAIGIAMMLVPLLAIVVLLFMKYCLPVSIAIFENIATLIGL